ncbi:MAG: hypothetical protein IH870_00435 [Chloroflexi bacterium]|nr:hypothetical protein [Chloroflexota bacterium]
MARSTPQIRRAPSPVRRSGGRSKTSTTFDATILLIVVALVAGLGFGFSEAIRHWAVNSLGFGWVPVGALGVAALLTLRYRPKMLAGYWRWWILAAVLAAIVVGILSYFRGPNGMLAAVSLGGRWGREIGGGYLPLGILRAVALVLLAPLILYPKRVGNLYLLALSGLFRALKVGGRYVGLRFYLLAKYLVRRIRAILNYRFLRRRLRRLSFRLMLPVGTRAGYSEAEDPPPWTSDEAGPDGFRQPADVSGSDVSGGGEVEPRTAVNDAQPAKAVAFNAAKSKWKLPPLNLLIPAQPRTISQAPLLQMAKLIESTLADHGVMVEVKDIKAGPRVVRFGLVPGWQQRRGEAGKDDVLEGSKIKVQSILAREKDLALALKTPDLRIEAPVPGEALVGLEVPAPFPAEVALRSLMDVPDFRKISSKGGLPIALGEDTGGNPVVTDLVSLPHLLIAGATGSGKSVCLNSIVASLLFTKPPDQLRIVMVDPKRVELTPFNGIPHLISPVIVDVEEVNPTLRALIAEMLRRYKLMEEIGTRNISGYNAKAKEPMPYLVLIVDELADLMMTGGFEMEQNLVRLAQLGRAVGIHLVLATQRPSVNVVTGLLKANVPARVAFAVASQVDSRVILDTVGAEKLLGKGDMLLLNNDSPKPRRVQGALVYDEEIDRVVEFWLQQKGPPLPVISLEEPDDLPDDQDEVDDRILDSARELAIRNPRLSSSFLERRLRIGVQKSAQVMEVLEEEGLVIPNY